MQSFILVRTIRGVPLLVHWTVPAICLFLLGAGIERFVTALCAMVAYLAILVVHELGHQVVAQRRGYAVMRVEIYPLHGLCRFDRPEQRFDAAWIASAGVLAQLCVAVPLS